MNSWSLLLSVAGFCLGLLSARSQLKDIGVSALRAGETWSQYIHTQADIFTKDTSALIAFLVQSAIRVVGILLALLVVAIFARDFNPHLPAWVFAVASAIAGGLIGLTFGNVSSIVGLVRKNANNHAASG